MTPATRANVGRGETRQMTELDRRGLLTGALALLGAAATGGTATVTFAASGAPRGLSPARFALLDEISGLVIPKTDTPGAREAGVARALDGLIADWARPETRRELEGALDAVDAAAKAELGASLVKAPVAARAEFLERYDQAAFARTDWPWRKLKDLVVTAYYMSEAGATQELRYELAPGAWEPWTPADANTRAWAA